MNGLLKSRLLPVVLLICTAGSAPADPRTDYLLYCRGCHLANGNGVPPDVPSLHDELGRILSVPGGREYLVRVPGVSQTEMTDEELAAVLNWVLAEFNADTLPRDFKPYTRREVAVARSKVLIDPLRYRAALLGEKRGQSPKQIPRKLPVN